MRDLDIHEAVFPSSPWSLIVVLVDNQRSLDCRWIVDIVVDESPLGKIFEVLTILLVVMYPSHPEWW